jgi:DNA polymerase/3'-5' exonuclease PolX
VTEREGFAFFWCGECGASSKIAKKSEAREYWNRRPAEEAMEAENEELAGYVKRFRETLAEVAKMANNSDQEQIFEKCRDALRDVYLEEIFRDKFDKILHAPDKSELSDKSDTKESEAKDEQ